MTLRVCTVRVVSVNRRDDFDIAVVGRHWEACSLASAQHRSSHSLTDTVHEVWFLGLDCTLPPLNNTMMAQEGKLKGYDQPSALKSAFAFGSAFGGDRLVNQLMSPTRFPKQLCHVERQARVRIGRTFAWTGSDGTADKRGGS